MKVGIIATLMTALGVLGAEAEAVRPQIVPALVNWPSAIQSVAGREGSSDTTILAQLNRIMSRHLPAVADSPVPVLVPFSPIDRSHDIDSGTDERLFGPFHKANFFHSGPAGYDAAFIVRTEDFPELSDMKFPAPIEVMISGSALLYELHDMAGDAGQTVAALETDFPGIRRTILEHHLRYTFVRYGVPYAISIVCLDRNGGSLRQKMPSCRMADKIAQRFMRSLRMVGGTPQPTDQNAQFAPPDRGPLQALDRPTDISSQFRYYPPGNIQPGTGYRGQSGRQDYTVYSQIRFPLAEAPASIRSERYWQRGIAKQAIASDTMMTTSAPWRDNFCERRAFAVSQCPAGLGHQGQDLKPETCDAGSQATRCRASADVVAVRSGVIRRAPRQEAAYLIVNSTGEHIRFRYLHMDPRKMDADELLSGRSVQAGDIIGQVSNFSSKNGGTSHHLHFDIQVPTKNGWVFVNPYMTLIAAYERLIGARGVEIAVPDAEIADAIKPPFVKDSKKKPSKFAKANKNKASRSQARFRSSWRYARR